MRLFPFIFIPLGFPIPYFPHSLLDSLHSHPNSPHYHPQSPQSHSYSLHSHHDSPHFHHSSHFHHNSRILTMIPRIPLIPFPNSLFRLLQMARKQKLFSSNRKTNVSNLEGYRKSLGMEGISSSAAMLISQSRIRLQVTTWLGIMDYNQFHKILRLFDVLPNFPFTTS